MPPCSHCTCFSTDYPLMCDCTVASLPGFHILQASGSWGLGLGTRLHVNAHTWHSVIFCSSLPPPLSLPPSLPPSPPPSLPPPLSLPPSLQAELQVERQEVLAVTRQSTQRLDQVHQLRTAQHQLEERLSTHQRNMVGGGGAASVWLGEQGGGGGSQCVAV